YSDRPCEDNDAIYRPSIAPQSDAARGYAVAPTAATHRLNCPRRPQDLVREITAAVHARDANRLSAVYDWVGVSKAAFDSTYRRLDALVQRPLLDIAPLYPPPPVVETVTDPDGASDVETAAIVDTPPRATGLIVRQTSSNGNALVSTPLQLRHRFDCLWIAF
ncbi:MAG: hypothetical protein LBV45_05785, partial [Xanthomonadaceae bacterium]|nr:hypothetical protein [Xanthomonadaceae bacterium]